MSTRAAAVAGFFYDSNPDQLRHDVNQLLRAVSAPVDSVPEALIVPHAGFIYSGSTAASAYKCLEANADRVKRVLLLGPAHRVHVEAMAIPTVDYFASPLGEVELDREALARIRDLPGVCEMDEAHRQEHCLEVQLPFLQSVLNQFTLIPVLVGGATPAAVAAVIDAFAGEADVLVVISSDLSHFLSSNEARRVDSNTCNEILDKATTLRGNQACGAAAINGLMASRWSQGLQIRLLQACNSGDTAGSTDRVVGYAAFALY
jgi:hypothetical protein